MNEHHPLIQFINLVAQLTFFGFVLYLAIQAWIEQGFWIMVFILFLASVFYPLWESSFPLSKARKERPRPRSRRINR